MESPLTRLNINHDFIPCLRHVNVLKSYKKTCSHQNCHLLLWWRCLNVLWHVLYPGKDEKIGRKTLNPEFQEVLHCSQQEAESLRRLPHPQMQLTGLAGEELAEQADCSMCLPAVQQKKITKAQTFFSVFTQHWGFPTPEISLLMKTREQMTGAENITILLAGCSSSSVAMKQCLWRFSKFPFMLQNDKM